MMFLPALNAYQPRNGTLNGSIPYDSLPCCTIHIQPRAPEHQSWATSLGVRLCAFLSGSFEVEMFPLNQVKERKWQVGHLRKCAESNLSHPPHPGLTVGLSRHGHYMEIFKTEKKPWQVHFQRFKGNTSVKVLDLLGPSYLKVLVPTEKYEEMKKEKEKTVTRAHVVPRK